MNIWQQIENLIAQHPTLRFWWRDDDLIEPTSQGDEMLRLAHDHAVPLALAVIPEPAQDTLVPWLHGNYHILQHGINHENHASSSDKKCEITAGCDKDQLIQGKAKLQKLFPTHFAPIIVPPWNRYAPEIEPFLRENYTYISTWGYQKSPDFFNVHLDLVKLTPNTLYEEIVKFIDAKTNEPCGVMTHHLVASDQFALLNNLIECVGATRFIHTPP